MAPSMSSDAPSMTKLSDPALPSARDATMPTRRHATGDRPLAWLGRAAWVLAMVSTLLYYAASDGVRFLVKAILSGGRQLMVGA